MSSPFRPMYLLKHYLPKWLITHLRFDEYMLKNTDFHSYASYDPNPKIEDPVLGKWDVAKAWRIRVVANPNICMSVGPVVSNIGEADFVRISPAENPDIFWMGPGGAHGTPVSHSKSHLASFHLLNYRSWNLASQAPHANAVGFYKE